VHFRLLDISKNEAYLRLQFFGEDQMLTQLTQITRAVFFDCPWYSLYQ
jgi:hypothetical protein